MWRWKVRWVFLWRRNRLVLSVSSAYLFTDFCFSVFMRQSHVISLLCYFCLGHFDQTKNRLNPSGRGKIIYIYVYMLFLGLPMVVFVY